MDGNIFPDDILFEIFLYLDGEMIKNCALVCKRWNNVIESSSLFMKHFRLNIKAENFTENTAQDILSLRRQFQEIRLEISDSRQNFYEISSHHGVKAEKLTVILNDNEIRLQSILVYFPVLVDLHVENQMTRILFSSKVSLPTLKFMKISNSNLNFLEILQTPRLRYFESIKNEDPEEILETFLRETPELESLVFRNDDNFTPIFQNSENLPFNLKVFEISNDNEAIVNGLESFLAKFSNLQDLTLSFGMASDVLFPEPQNTPFKLTKLNFELWSPYIGGIINDNYCAFLQTQRDSLEEIKSVSIFCPTVEIDSEFLIMFTEMRKLARLTFDVKNPFPKSDEFYQDLQPITTVKELRFVDLDKITIQFEDKLTKFLRMMLPLFPNLEIFECPRKSLEGFPEFTEYLTANNPKLMLVSLFD